jgi:hypothetical protein
MGRNVKRLKNYTAEQVEMLFESDENSRISIKLYAILHEGTEKVSFFLITITV